MEFKKAAKCESKLRVAISGAAGSGKTYSALQIARGIGGPVALIDTERGSASLYADLFNFDVLNIEPLYTPEKYIEAMLLAEKNGYNVIVIDSLSHAWAGSGGLLDLHDSIQKSNKGGNSFTAWKEITPLYNKLIDAITGSKIHVICTFRAKQEYLVEQSNNRMQVRKVGLNPVIREGAEYEYTVFMELSQEHVAVASKDRTNLFDGKYFVPSEQTGKTLVEWLYKPAVKTVLELPQADKVLITSKTETTQTVGEAKPPVEPIKRRLTIQDIAKELRPELKVTFNRLQLTTRQIVELWELHDGQQDKIITELSKLQERKAA